MNKSKDYNQAEALERLRKAIDYIKSKYNLTNEGISEQLEYRSKAYVSEILGGSKPISNFFLIRISASFHINDEWIKFGEGEMVNKFAEQTSDNVRGILRVKDVKSNKEIYRPENQAEDAPTSYFRKKTIRDFLQDIDNELKGGDPASKTWLQLYQQLVDKEQALKEEYENKLAQAHNKYEDIAHDYRDLILKMLEFERNIVARLGSGPDAKAIKEITSVMMKHNNDVMHELLHVLDHLYRYPFRNKVVGFTSESPDNKSKPPLI